MKTIIKYRQPIAYIYSIRQPIAFVKFFFTFFSDFSGMGQSFSKLTSEYLFELQLLSVVETSSAKKVNAVAV